jgi:uncharacterized protein YbaA (DUF1428 family)
MRARDDSAARRPVARPLGIARRRRRRDPSAMRYVDGFVIPLPKKNVRAYKTLAQKAAKVWCDHGALQYFECVGEDLETKFGVPFTRLAKTKPGETVVFAWIVYKSRAHRDKVNGKVMQDPRIAQMMAKGKKPPFDMKRMTMGGFDVLVRA